MNTDCYFTDTHIHLDRYDPLQVNLLLQNSRSKGIKRFIVPDISFSLNDSSHFLSSIDGVYCCWGCHPQWSFEKWQDCYSKFAVGECGLDSTCVVDIKIQEECFISQLKAAEDNNLPLLIHCVRSYGKILDILDNNSFNGSGVIHGFSGSKEIAKRFIDKGFALGIGLLVTNSYSRRVKEAITYVGAEHIVLETDAPFFRNASPLNLIDVAHSCCELLKCSMEHLSIMTETSVDNIFKIGKYHDQNL